MVKVRTTALIIGIAILSSLTGCAKSPSGPITTGKQLVLTLKVRGRINPATGHYFIAIDNDGDHNTGPWAVVYPSQSGNGWGTSEHADQSKGITSYLQYDDNNQECYLRGMVPGSSFTQPTPPQPPIQADLLEGGSTLRVVIDFSQIATKAFPVDKIKQLDINFITTNSISRFENLNRIWDGLGPSGKNYVPVDTTTDQPYSGDNADGPSVSDPDLDIVYWSIEVQTVTSR